MMYHRYKSDEVKKALVSLDDSKWFKLIIIAMVIAVLIMVVTMICFW